MNSQMQAAKAAMTRAAEAVLRGDPDAVDLAVDAIEQLRAAQALLAAEAELADAAAEMPSDEIDACSEAMEADDAAALTDEIITALGADEPADELADPCAALWPGFSRWPGDRLPDGWTRPGGGSE